MQQRFEVEKGIVLNLCQVRFCNNLTEYRREYKLVGSKSYVEQHVDPSLHHIVECWTVITNVSYQSTSANSWVTVISFKEYQRELLLRTLMRCG